jgi:glycosyltransferase involved in cell wall biosynthesis
VARRRGGALDTVIDGATGSFFDEPAPQAVAAAAARVPANASSACRASALRFSSDRFDELMRAQIARLLATRANSQRQV